MIQSIKNWLYLPEGYQNLIRRLTGFLTLPVALFVWNWSQGGPGPYVAGAWRIGDHVLSLPWPPQILNIIVFSAWSISCLFLMAGAKRKIFVLIPLAALVYYGSRDFFACASHVIIMDFCLLLSLALSCDGLSPTRRLLQIALTTCYGYSTLQKLIFPDFIMGTSMESWFHDGFGMNFIWQPFVKSMSFPHWFWLLGAIFTVLVEGFLTVGFWFPKTRMLAVKTGVVLHGLIVIFMEFWLIPFALEMFTCYLAFFDGKKQVAEDAQPEPILTRPARYLNFALASASVLLMIFIPLRIYFWPDRPINTLTLFDRTPWAFCMYLMRQQNVATQIFYEDSQGNWVEDENLELRKGAKGETRMATASADNELYAISDLAFERHPDAKAVRVEIAVSINKIEADKDRWLQKKSLIVDRSAKAARPVLTVTNLYR